MSGAPTRQSGDRECYTVYEEFDLETGRVAAIADSENAEAWICSDLTAPIEA